MRLTRLLVLSAAAAGAVTLVVWFRGYRQAPPPHNAAGAAHQAAAAAPAAAHAADSPDIAAATPVPSRGIPSLIAAIVKLDFALEQNTANGLFQELEQLLRAHPEQLPLLADQTQALAPTDPFFMERVAFFTGLLAESSDPAAEALLSRLLATATHETVAIQAVAALGDLRHPTQSGADALLTAYRASPSATVRDMALLAFGSVAGRTRGQPAGDLLDAQLVGIVKAAAPADRLALLAPMGNAGGSVYLPFIEPYLADPDPLIRARAVYELRKIPGDDTLALMTRVMVKDAHQVVRAEGLKAMAARPSSSAVVAAVWELYASAGSSDEKQQILRLAVSAGRCCVEGVAARLQEISTSDADAAVRDTAFNLGQQLLKVP